MIYIVIVTLLTQVALASDSLMVSIDLTAEDRVGKKHTITCGLHSRASSGFDPFIGDIPVPPAPSVDMFDLRFLDPPGVVRTPNSGMYVDARRYNNVSQTDTFIVRVTSAMEDFPITLSWSLLKSDQSTTAYLFGTKGDSTFMVEMLEQSSISVDEPSKLQLHLSRNALRKD